jgi:hypothetical protein
VLIAVEAAWHSRRTGLAPGDRCGCRLVIGQAPALPTPRANPPHQTGGFRVGGDVPLVDAPMAVPRARLKTRRCAGRRE